MKEKSIKTIPYVTQAVMLCIYLAMAGSALAQSETFTYQGKLTDGGLPANGNYDILFRLFDTPTGGSARATRIVFNTSVTNGTFTAQVEFTGCVNCFTGPSRFLEIAISPAGNSTFTTLSPRQPVTSTPYAIRSQTATSADGLSVACVKCITSSQIASVTGNAVTGTIPVASIPSGSGSYIQNTTSQQTSSNFNISGDGTAGGQLTGGSVSAATNFRIGALRMLDASGPLNNGGINLGLSNTFLGDGAGQNTTPNANVLSFGGKLNAFFGAGAGRSNFDGSGNAFFGATAGEDNDGNNNSFFGAGAGRGTTSGGENVFIGRRTGESNTTGLFNTFVGVLADFDSGNSTGIGTTLLGYRTTGPTSGKSNATAIGYHAQVDRSNSLVLGAISGVNGCSSSTFCNSVNVGIGTTQPVERLHIAVNDGNILLGANGCNPGNASISFSATATVCSNYSLLGNGTDTVINRTPGGTISFREGNTSQVFILPGGNVQVTQKLRIDSLGSAGSTNLCLNSSNQISTCSSSARYKSNVKKFGFGLNLIQQLRPVSFNWKQNGAPDFGLVAEEVAKVEPLLTIRNDKGEIEGVKYDRVSVVLVNAVNEQQAQIQKQQTQIAELQDQVRQQHALIAELTRQIKGQPSKAQGRKRR